MSQCSSLCRWLVLMSVALLTSFRPIEPQALCALRDPVRQITRLFPDADAYESIVGTVGQGARKAVSKRLPFTLHFNELGRHTLYAVKKEGRPVGFVHVRSEAGQWGLVEIAWALDMDLRLVGYEFQRCRDRSKSVLTTQSVRDSLAQKDFKGLKELINEDGTALAQSVRFVPKSARALAATVFRSGLKTIAVTECVWPKEVASLRALSLAQRHRPEAAKAIAQQDLFGEAALRNIESVLGSERVGIDRARSTAHVILDDDGARLGWVAETPWEYDEATLLLRWCFDHDGTIQSVGPRGGWRSEEFRAAFSHLVGLNAADAIHCTGASGVVALEVALGLGLGSELVQRASSR